MFDDEGFNSRIVDRMAFIAEELTAGLNPQKSLLSRKRMEKNFAHGHRKLVFAVPQPSPLNWSPRAPHRSGVSSRLRVKEVPGIATLCCYIDSGI